MALLCGLTQLRNILIICASIFSTTQVSATISLITENSTVAVESTAIITCVVRTDDPTTTVISWEKDGYNLINNSKVTLYSRHVQVLEYSYTQTSVEVCNIEVEDEGEYACVTSDGALRRTTQLNVVNTTVTEAAQVILLSSNTTVDTQTTIFLTCVGYGVPTPTVTWEMQGVSVTNNTRGTIQERVVLKGGKTFVQSILELCNIQPFESGIYSCVVESGSTTQTLSTEVTVVGNATIDSSITTIGTSSIPEETTGAPQDTTEAPSTPEASTEVLFTPEENTEAPSTPDETTEVLSTPEEESTEPQSVPEETREVPTVMVCSESIQLLIGPINDCLDWKFNDPVSKANTILSTIHDRLLDNPSCTPINPEFFCVANHLQSVAFKADISGEVDQCNCAMAVQELTKWIREGASVRVEANRLYINSNCDIQISSNSDQIDCNNVQATDPANVGGGDNSRYIIIGASGGVVVVILILFISSIIVGALCYKGKKKKSSKMMKKVKFSTASLPEWDLIPDPVASNDIVMDERNPCYQDSSMITEPVYNDISDAIVEKEKYQSMNHRQSQVSINPYELDYEVSTFNRNTKNKSSSQSDRNTESENETYVIMNPTSSQ